MAKIPGIVQMGGPGQYSATDLQAALAHGPQVANSTARTAAESTQPYVNSANLMFSEMMKEAQFKRQYGLQKAQMRSQNVMAMAKLGTDMAFGAIGAVQQGQMIGETVKMNDIQAGKLTEMQAFNKNLADSAGATSDQAAALGPSNVGADGFSTTGDSLIYDDTGNVAGSGVVNVKEQGAPNWFSRGGVPIR